MWEKLPSRNGALVFVIAALSRVNERFRFYCKGQQTVFTKLINKYKYTLWVSSQYTTEMIYSTVITSLETEVSNVRR